uniref:GRIP domain-containing protein n=1 Tax=Rhabditophanes sp. KR3021 TaxID=114890 RepID=A0AC35UF30_9BILA
MATWFNKIQGQIQEFAQDVLNEATDDVVDADAEISVLKQKLLDAETRLTSEQAKATQLESRLHAVSDVANTNETGVSEVKAKFKSILSSKEKEISNLKVENEKLKEELLTCDIKSPKKGDDDEDGANQELRKKLQKARKEISDMKKVVAAKKDSENVVSRKEMEDALSEAREKHETQIAALVGLHEGNVQELRNEYEELWREDENKGAIVKGDEWKKKYDAILNEFALFKKSVPDSSKFESEIVQLKKDNEAEIIKLQNEIITLKMSKSRKSSVDNSTSQSELIAVKKENGNISLKLSKAEETKASLESEVLTLTELSKKIPVLEQDKMDLLQNKSTIERQLLVLQQELVTKSNLINDLSEDNELQQSILDGMRKNISNLQKKSEETTAELREQFETLLREKIHANELLGMDNEKLDLQRQLAEQKLEEKEAYYTKELGNTNRSVEALMKKLDDSEAMIKETKVVLQEARDEGKETVEKALYDGLLQNYNQLVESQNKEEDKSESLVERFDTVSANLSLLQSTNQEHAEDNKALLKKLHDLNYEFDCLKVSLIKTKETNECEIRDLKNERDVLSKKITEAIDRKDQVMGEEVSSTDSKKELKRIKAENKALKKKINELKTASDEELAQSWNSIGDECLESMSVTTTQSDGESTTSFEQLPDSAKFRISELKAMVADLQEKMGTKVYEISDQEEEPTLSGMIEKDKNPHLPVSVQLINARQMINTLKVHLKNIQKKNGHPLVDKAQFEALNLKIAELSEENKKYLENEENNEMEKKAIEVQFERIKKRLEEECQSSVDENEALRRDIESLRSDVETLEKQHSDDMTLKESKYESELAELSNEINDWRDLLENERATGKESEHLLNEQIYQLKEQLSLVKSNDALPADNEEKGQKEQVLLEQIEVLNKELAEVKAVNESLTTQFSNEKEHFAQVIIAKETKIHEIESFLTAKHSESQGYYEKIQELLKQLGSRDSILKLKETEITNVKEYANELEAGKKKCETELARLKDHLIMIEQQTTAEQISSEDRETALRKEISELQSLKVKTSENLTEAQERLERKVTELKSELGEMDRTKKALEVELIESRNELKETENSLSKLRTALVDLTADQELEIQKYRDQLEEHEREYGNVNNSFHQLESLQKQWKEDESHFQTIINELQKKLSERSQELADVEMQLTQIHNEKEGQSNSTMSRKSSKTDLNLVSSTYRIDDHTLRQLFLSFFMADESKQPEIGVLLSSILNYSNEERDRILQHAQQLSTKHRGWFGSLVGPSIGLTQSAETNRSLTEQFVKFLENESKVTKNSIAVAERQNESKEAQLDMS